MITKAFLMTMLIPVGIAACARGPFPAPRYPQRTISIAPPSEPTSSAPSPQTGTEPVLTRTDPTPTATASPLIASELLWIHTEGQPYWRLLDTATKIEYRVDLPQGCDPRPAPNSMILICGFPPPGAYLLDLASGERTPMPARDLAWADFAPDGRYMYYEIRDPSAGSTTVFTFDIQEGKERILVEGVPYGTWREPPFLSNGASHLAVMAGSEGGGSRVFELDDPSTSRRPLSPEGLFTTGGMDWSPVGSKLVYGVTFVDQEIGPRANALYLTDPSTGETRLLAKAPEGEFYSDFWGQSLWSPQGSYIAIRAGPRLCIIRISTREQECIMPGTPESRVARWSWSEDESKLAFTLTERALEIPARILVLDITSKDVIFEADVFESVDALFWRPFPASVPQQD